MKKYAWLLLALFPVVAQAQADTESITYENYSVSSEDNKVTLILDFVQVNAELDLPNNRIMDVGSIRWQLRFAVQELYFEGVKVPLSRVPSLGENAVQVDNLTADIYIGATRFKTIKIGGVADYARISRQGMRGVKSIFDDTFDLNFGENQDVETYKEYARRGIKIENLRLQASYAGMMTTARSEMEAYVMEIQSEKVVQNADQLFDQGNYEQAKEQYREALRIQSGNEHARSRIREIDELLAQQKAEEEYNTAMQNAEEAEGTEDKIRYYNEALRIKPDDPQATEAIRELREAEEAASSQEAEEEATADGAAAGSGAAAAAGTAAGSAGSGSSSGAASGTEAEAEADEGPTQAEREAEAEAKRQEDLAEYRAFKDEQRRRNQAIAASSAAASGTALYYLGGFIYGDMGKIDTDHVFRGQGFHIGFQYGYTSTVQPIFLNSDYINEFSGDRVTETETRYALTVNLDLLISLGYESRYVGGYGYYSPFGGFSPIFDAFSYSIENFGGRVFAGLENIKGYYDLSRGDRYIYKLDYLSGNYGEGEIYHKFQRQEYGLMVTFNKSRYIRNHLFFGVITEFILDRSDDYDNYSRVQNLDSDNLSLLNNNFLEEQLVTGYTFQWKRDQHFNFYLNVFPEYPFTGTVDFGFASDASDDPGVLIEVGFVRALDQWH